MSESVTDEGGILTAPHVLEYPYRRSVGPVLGRFFTGLRDGKLLGVRAARPRAGAAGRVRSRERRVARRARPGRPRRRGRRPGPGSTTRGRSTRSIGRSRGRWSSSTAPTRRCCTRSTPASERAHAHGHARAAALARRARGRHPRHRLLRAGGLSMSDERAGHQASRRRFASSTRYTRGPRDLSASCSAWPRAASSASAARSAARCTCRRAARARRCGGADRRRGRGVREGHGHDLLHRAHSLREPVDVPAAFRRARTSCSTAPTSRSSRSCTSARSTQVRMGMRVQAVWVPKEELDADLREHPLLPTARRARRALRVATRSTSECVTSRSCPSRRRRATRRESAQRGRDPDAGGAGGRRSARASPRHEIGFTCSG